jgi:hypothetical protein
MLRLLVLGPGGRTGARVLDMQLGMRIRTKVEFINSSRMFDLSFDIYPVDPCLSGRASKPAKGCRNHNA